MSDRNSFDYHIKNVILKDLKEIFKVQLNTDVLFYHDSGKRLQNEDALKVNILYTIDIILKRVGIEIEADFDVSAFLFKSKAFEKYGVYNYDNSYQRKTNGGLVYASCTYYIPFETIQNEIRATGLKELLNI